MPCQVGLRYHFNLSYDQLVADKKNRMQHRAADRDNNRKALADKGKKMQHRAVVRACQAQRQKSEHYRKKSTKSASIGQKYRLQHDAAYQKCHQVVCKSTFNAAKWR